MADKSGKISVACKLPSGFTIEHAGTRLTLNGPNDPGAIGDFGVTRGVDADWFKEWSEGGKDGDGKLIGVGKGFAPLASGAIFAIPGSDLVGAVNDIGADVVTGLEPLNADKPAPDVEPTDEQKKELDKLRDGPKPPRARAAGRKPAGKPGEAKSNAPVPETPGE